MSEPGALPKAEPLPKSIKDLVDGVRNGRIILPRFQRGFPTWPAEQRLKLLDSIGRSYPMGSILLWESHDRDLAAERQIGDIEVTAYSGKDPVQYVLDGQQRLGVICSAIFSPGTSPTGNWNIVYDLEKQSFVYLGKKSEPEAHQVRLSNLLDHAGYRRQSNLLSKLPDDERVLYLQRLDVIMDRFSGYTVPVVTLKDTPRDIIAEIFERINRYGKRLTTVDLIQAATWRDDFDLNKSINSIRKSISKQGFAKLEPINFLRNISAATGRRFFAGSIMSLGKAETKDLDQAVKVTKQGYELAVDFLVSDLGVLGEEWLPYANQVTILAEVFRRKRHPDAQALEQWFWKTSITDYFQGWNTARMEEDLNRIEAFSEGRINSIGDESRRSAPSPKIWEDKYSKKNALTRAFLVLLARRNPIDPRTGMKIAVRAASNRNALDMHHVFPDDYLKHRGYERNQRDALGNRVFLKAETNRWIKAKAPSEYLPLLPKEFLEPWMAASLISDEAYQAALRDDYEAFLEARCRAIHDEAIARAGWE